MSVTFEVPAHVKANIARREAAESRVLRCVYGCAGEAHLYPAGVRCDEHSPWAVAGLPDPRTQVDPRYTAEALRARMQQGQATPVAQLPAQVAQPSAQVAQLPTDTITERWQAFDAKNPHVRARLVELVEQAIARGERRIGIGALFEQLRWTDRTETNGDHYRLNHDFRAVYVRALIADRPEWERLFELRQRRTA